MHAGLIFMSYKGCVSHITAFFYYFTDLAETDTDYVKTNVYFKKYM